MKMMYYPFVQPPRPVIWQALLYWDALTSISPEDGYQFEGDLIALRDLGLYQPAHADDLPPQARDGLVSDLRQVAAELPGDDLVPVPGPLSPDNRVFWGKLPYIVEDDLIEIGALVPDSGLLRGSPVLLSRLMVVLARHMAAAAQGVVPFTDSPGAEQVAFAPMGPDLGHRRCWQLQIGHLLPTPAPDVPLTKILDFRDAYADEREELAAAVRKLLLSASGQAGNADPARLQDDIKKAVRRLEKAGRSRKIVWLKRSLWVLTSMGLAAAGAHLLPQDDWLFGTMADLGINVATADIRTGAPTEFAYLQHLRSSFPGTSWPAAQPRRSAQLSVPMPRNPGSSNRH